MIKFLGIVIFGLLALPLEPSAAPSESSSAAPRTPVLVELFTSEGCSSCPPADKFLQDIDTSQPIAGAELIVLSEHVDYWNHDGWKDPFSSASITERQNAYGARFKINSVYTPQMIVDGDAQFVGNSPQTAQPVFERAAAVSKVPIHLSAVVLEGNRLRAHLSVGALPASERAQATTMMDALHAEYVSKVAACTKGENTWSR